jgi:hypothetical protein
VLADALALTNLAAVAHCLVLTNSRATAVYTLTPCLAMEADLGSPTLFAHVLVPAVWTNLGSTTHLAPAPYTVVLTQTTTLAKSTLGSVV